MEQSQLFSFLFFESFNRLYLDSLQIFLVRSPRECNKNLDLLVEFAQKSQTPETLQKENKTCFHLKTQKFSFVLFIGFEN